MTNPSCGGAPHATAIAAYSLKLDADFFDLEANADAAQRVNGFRQIEFRDRAAFLADEERWLGVMNGAIARYIGVEAGYAMDLSLGHQPAQCAINLNGGFHRRPFEGF